MRTGFSYENSLWWSSIEHPAFNPGPINSAWDVAIIGGGFSGLWCAHHLLNNNPGLAIAIFEKNLVGSGASGRNGGWASALYPMSDRALGKCCGGEEITALHLHLAKSIDEIGEFDRHNAIGSGFFKGGSLSIARNKGQLERIEKNNPQTFLGGQELNTHIHMQGAMGGSFTQECAVLNPTALVVGLAKNLAARGVSIFENIQASQNSEGVTVSVDGEEKSIKSKYVVEAIEAYRDRTRHQIPIYSLMVATEPLSESDWEQIGLNQRESFAENRHMVTYAQRTSDNRLAIGGRGAPYLFASKRKDSSEGRAQIHSQIRSLAIDWFPILKERKFTHAWGGAVGVTRDWSPYVHWDGRLGALGGYGGDGVTLSYLAANSLADLISGNNSDRASLPFVNWHSKKWEPEPLRWLGVNLAITLTKLADVEERITHRASLLGKIIERLF